MHGTVELSVSNMERCGFVFCVTWFVVKLVFRSMACCQMVLYIEAWYDVCNIVVQKYGVM